MIRRDTRETILNLHKAGHGLRAIAKLLGCCRNSVRTVLLSGVADAASIIRPEKLAGYEERIRELYTSCNGNLIRVHEELVAEGLELKYTTLTSFCRRHKIGVKPQVPAGRYDFNPGEEAQHDTSPHDAVIGGRKRRVQTASLVYCHSRAIFAQAYPRYNRFWAKVFLTDALVALGGSCSHLMVDNSNVLIAHGSGPDAVPAPDIEALGRHFGFTVVAHRVGDANRSGRVERPFHFIENNFFAGREFRDLEHLNQELRAWCTKANAIHRRHLGARPIDLLTAERPFLQPLPVFVGDPTEVEQRYVDVEGYVTFRTNRYSAPPDMLHRQVQVVATKDRVRLFDGHRLLAEHRRHEDGARQRFTLPAHERRALPARDRARPQAPEVVTLCAVAPDLAEMVTQLKQRHGARGIRAIRALHQLYIDYPTEPLLSVVRSALDFGLLDPDRIERMVLRALSGDIFRLDTEPAPTHPDTESPHEEDRQSTQSRPVPTPESVSPSGDASTDQEAGPDTKPRSR